METRKLHIETIYHLQTAHCTDVCVCVCVKLTRLSFFETDRNGQGTATLRGSLLVNSLVA